jgi:hypothetical protein
MEECPGPGLLISITFIIPRSDCLICRDTQSKLTVVYNLEAYRNGYNNQNTEKNG